VPRFLGKAAVPLLFILAGRSLWLLVLCLY
jgi:hypothetical protein